MGIGMMKSGIFLFLAVLAYFLGFWGDLAIEIESGMLFYPWVYQGKAILDKFSLIFKQFLKKSKNIFKKNRFSLKTAKKTSSGGSGTYLRRSGSSRAFISIA